MNFESQLIEQIEVAFDGVVLGEGVSLRRAAFIESHGMAVGCEELAETDERYDWRKISDSTLESFSETFCFTDLLGYRFYIAPYMIWTLKNYRSSDNIIGDFTIYALDPSRHQFREVAFSEWFTEEQLVAIVAFLEFCVRNDGWLDGKGAQRNLAALLGQWTR